MTYGATLIMLILSKGMFAMAEHGRKRFFWCLKAFLGWGLAGACLCTSALTPAAAGAQAQADQPPEVLWTTSFEEGDPAVEAVPVDDRQANIGLPMEKPGVIPSSISAEPDGQQAGQMIGSVFDGSLDSKFLTANDHSDIRFQLDAPLVLKRYFIGSAADSSSFSGRDPKDWTFEGSLDGEHWTVLDTVTGNLFKEDKKLFAFSLADNTQAFDHYRLHITANNGDKKMQFSILGWSEAESDDQEVPLPVPDPTHAKAAVMTVDGKLSVVSKVDNAGWDGKNVLKFAGTYVDPSEDAKSYVRIHDGLSIPVAPNTQLSYMIMPQPADPENYDFNQISNWASLDLKFDDGSYLSQLNCPDRDGNLLSPMGQGDGKTLVQFNWNHIVADIGAVAAGKTITEVLVGYEKQAFGTGEALGFVDYFDQITIANVERPDLHSTDYAADYVNTLRGTYNGENFSRGNAVPATTLPHGFNQLIPITEGVVGANQLYQYQQSGSTTYAKRGGGTVTKQNNTLSHIAVDHFTSVYNSDYGSFQFMVNSSFDAGNPSSLNPGNVEGTAGGRNAAFRHENEIARPYLYQVTFDDYDPDDPGTSKAPGCTMAVTPAMHSGVARFTYPAGSDFANVVLDQERAAGSTTVQEDGSFFGYSDHTAFGSTRMYFCGRFDTTPTAIANVGSGIKKVIQFGRDLEEETQVEMVFATSFISADQAWHNLELELGVTQNDYARGLFQKTCDAAHDTWNQQLGVISDIEGATYEQLCSIYTGLYKMYSYPILGAENVGTNEAPIWKHMDVSEEKENPADTVVSDGIIYFINDFWGECLTTYPAWALFSPNQMGDILDGVLQQYKDGGWMPRWMRPGPSTSMIGTSTDIVFADAMARGIQFDWETAYESALKNSQVYSSDPKLGRKLLDRANFLGYTYRDGEVLTSSELSWSLLNAQCDYSIAQMAGMLGYTDEQRYFANKSAGYSLLYDPVDVTDKGNGGFLRPKDQKGDWSQSSYDPKSWWGPCVETNIWNSQFIQFDLSGLAGLYGGREVLESKLDDFFATVDDTTKNTAGKIHEQVEQRENKFGMLGMENQPSFHIPYVYNEANAPYKTQALTREMLRRLFVGADIGQGYCGDEDNGSTSAWYILTALGIYPLNPGSGEFAITSPLFTQAVIHMDNGETLTISAPDNGRDQVYIQSVELNGQAYSKNYIAHADLAQGGTLTFHMGDTPSQWGTGEAAMSQRYLTPGGEQPSYTQDLTVAGMQTAQTVDRDSQTPMLASGITELEKLVDNDSLSGDVLISGREREVIYYNPAPQVVTMYTLTSGGDAAKAPADFALYGSNDGRGWTELDARQGEKFAWEQYTRSFGVAEENQGAYTYYKLAVADESDTLLAEVELFGREAIIPNQLVIAPDTLELAVGETDQLIPTFSPADAYQALSWRSSDEAVATVDADGKVTALAAGQAIITAVSQLDAEVKGSCTVTVRTQEEPNDPDQDAVDAAKAAAEKALAAFKATNDTTADHILKAVTDAVDNADVTVAWKDPFQKDPAAGDTSGSITGSLTLTVGEAAAVVTVELAIPPIGGELVQGDLDMDEEVTIADVMEACKVMARESAGNDPTDEEIARGDLDGDGEITIADVMEICKILARTS